MRRFLETRTGKAICHLVVFGLMLPFVSYVLASTAHAQIQVRPKWAVIPFVNNAPGKGGADYGNQAAQAVYDELAKTNNYDLVPLDSVNRSIQTLGMTTPVTDPTSLLRLAQDLEVTKLVTGNLLTWNVERAGGGRQATIAMKVVVLDVASGLPINGAAVQGANSSVRATGTSQDLLVSEALAQGASQAVSRIQTQILPTATVLNTRVNEGLINRGARDGFKDGQTVIVTRGREQVATASVFDTEADSSNIKIMREIKGIQPGDKVQVVFEVPDIGVRKYGTDLQAPVVVTHNPPAHVNASGIISAGLVLGVVAFVLSGGRANSNNAVDSVVAQPTNFPTNAGNPVIQISWRLDPFYRNANNVQFIIFRNDYGDIPVQVADGDVGQVFDDTNARNITTFFPLPDINSLACDTAPAPQTFNAVPGVTLGVPYLYQVAGLYRVLEIDIPGVTTTGGTTGLTSGTTVGTTGTTLGTTGTTLGTTGTTVGTTGLTVGSTGLTGLIGHRATGPRRPQATTGLTATTGTTATTTATTGATATAGTTGTTATTTGNGTTNAGTTGQITTTGSYCFFQSAKSTAQGFATALGRPQLVSPSENAAVVGYPVFTFSSLATQAAPIQVGYVVQLSPSPVFPKTATLTSPEKISADLNAQSITFNPRFTGDTFAQLIKDHFGNGITQIYWRVGGRNIQDNPGPLPDPFTGLRYVFCQPNTFTLAGTGGGPKAPHAKATTTPVKQTTHPHHTTTVKPGGATEPSTTKVH